MLGVDSTGLVENTKFPAVPVVLEMIFISCVAVVAEKYVLLSVGCTQNGAFVFVL